MEVRNLIYFLNNLDSVDKINSDLKESDVYMTSVAMIFRLYVRNSK